MDDVVTALVDGIEHERRHVRLPKRNALFPILTETPRRMTELLLTGVRAQDDSETSPMTIPRTVDDLTPEWCSEALGRTITPSPPTPLGVGVGLVGQLFQLELDGPDGPSTVVAKLAAPTDEGRFVATVLNMYGREVGFYSELSTRTSIGHPACHFAEHDPETQDTVLLLEDVSPRGRLLDQVAGCSVRRRAVRRSASSPSCTRASGTTRRSTTRRS